MNNVKGIEERPSGKSYDGKEFLISTRIGKGGEEGERVVKNSEQFIIAQNRTQSLMKTKRISEFSLF